MADVEIDVVSEDVSPLLEEDNSEDSDENRGAPAYGANVSGSSPTRPFGGSLSIALTAKDLC
jgi:hypothetical protein